MRRHELDPVSLIFGLAYAALGLALLGGVTLIDLRAGRIGPLVLIGAGVALALVVVARQRRVSTNDAPAAPEDGTGAA